MQHPLPDRDYKVITITYTYNQEKYIEDTLKGIIMQKTDFPFVALVLDDCSTDGTAEIIRRYESMYPDLIKGIYEEENYFSQGKQQEDFIQPWRMRSVYQAFCEGDDYWTDPYKLQKQADFMDAHPNCVLSFHNALEHWEDGSQEDKVFYNVESREYTGSEIFKNWVVSTASVMTRTDVCFKKALIDNTMNTGFLYYDIVFFLSCGLYGSFMGMNDMMSVYRRLDNGFTLHFKENKMKSPELLWKYCLHNHNLAITFGDKYGKDFKEEAITRFVINAISGFRNHLCRRKFQTALVFLYRCFSYYPKDTVYFLIGSLKRNLFHTK